MYVELDNTNSFVAYCKSLTEVAPEHAKFVIQITDALYTSLQLIMPWQITTPDFTKIYDTPDIALFVEIVIVQGPTLQSQINDNSDAITTLMEALNG